MESMDLRIVGAQNRPLWATLSLPPFPSIPSWSWPMVSWVSRTGLSFPGWPSFSTRRVFPSSGSISRGRAWARPRMGPSPNPNPSRPIASPSKRKISGPSPGRRFAAPSIPTFPPAPGLSLGPLAGSGRLPPGGGKDSRDLGGGLLVRHRPGQPLFFRGQTGLAQGWFFPGGEQPHGADPAVRSRIS